MNNISCIRQQADAEQIGRCRESVEELGSTFAHLSNGLAMAGNQVRLKILYLLHGEGRLCVCDLSDILGMTVPAVSQHLRKLKDRGLLESERRAQTIFYSLAGEYGQLFMPFFEILDERKTTKAL
ncbi:regulatory protein, arsR family [Flagellimonas taeanensis]|uniref:Regulatory protein, arsR family n=1 Tax=Flagellimonas taeanensis TaxID=1005926 RepID=A0A1M6Y338_9FLAO|nr:metalloregulator ArsR/SmtB family transcription factor [Allomuricauda taeanensis]SFC05105.1 regulatory protein, arsR family [Allomuricauda taeanensis]SHL12681.1 transcriptional regulator, ArsR family [Allomuricauda taeanensis]